MLRCIMFRLLGLYYTINCTNTIIKHLSSIHSMYTIPIVVHFGYFLSIYTIIPITLFFIIVHLMVHEDLNLNITQ